MIFLGKRYVFVLLLTVGSLLSGYRVLAAVGPPDFTRCKLEALFKALDADHDGLLSKDDLREIVRLLAASLKISGEKGNNSQKEAEDKAWKLLPLDKLRLGKPVTLAEFVEYVKKSIASGDPAFRKKVENIIQITCVTVNWDGDKNTLSFKEWKDFCLLRNMNGNEAVASYNRMDTNGDGKVSHIECVAADTDFFFGTSVAGPGAWFYGFCPK